MKFLLVEDNIELARAISSRLRLDGHVIDHAAKLEDASEFISTGEYDLILLDIMLPKLNGYEICRQLREREIESTIIMLTAKGQEDDIIRGLELGADDYVTKPFSIRELLARSKAFLRRKDEPPREVYEFGDCQLDLTSHKLHRAEQEVPLTSKEFGLLEYMVTRAGRALARSEILDRVWGTSVIVTERSVDRCVTTLRSKIEPDPGKPKWIKTIRDVGYRFESE